MNDAPATTNFSPSSPTQALVRQFGGNAWLAMDLLDQYRRDPRSVPESWLRYFQGLDLSLPGSQGGRAELEQQARLLQLIRAYRVRGHLVADLDPLGAPGPAPEELEPASYGLTPQDHDREFFTNGLAGKDRGTLGQIMEVLRQTYCRTVGAEYMFIQEFERREWLQARMEASRNRAALDREDRLRILAKLVDAEGFERYLHARYIGHKRFSLEGAEALIPLLDRMLSEAAQSGLEEAVLGMPHRGRLNVLANTVGKPLSRIFAEFEGNLDPETTQGSGDVKYHLGAAGTHRAPGGETITVTLAPNPSHLEAVNPVVEGLVRARQDLRGDLERARTLPILLHGDAAFAGEGVVAETLNLAGLEGYTTGGTIHVVVNNQIGFTTLPQDARSSTYCTDVARMVQAPVLHVNGDDPEAVVHVAALAFEYRQRFRRDVVIDLVCYRRWGHNEGDEPSYTQPLMYAKIHAHRPVAESYGETLVREGVIRPPERAALVAGKLAYDLLDAREGAEVAILRLEQLHPFPGAELARALQRFPASAERVWAQEEPRNQGAWEFVRGCFLDGKVPGSAGRAPAYAGRAAAAATATGSHKAHLQEQADVVRQALALPGPTRPKGGGKDPGATV